MFHDDFTSSYLYAIATSAASWDAALRIDTLSNNLKNKPPILPLMGFWGFGVLVWGFFLFLIFD